MEVVVQAVGVAATVAVVLVSALVLVVVVVVDVEEVVADAVEVVEEVVEAVANPVVAVDVAFKSDVGLVCTTVAEQAAVGDPAARPQDHQIKLRNS